MIPYRSPIKCISTCLKPNDKFLNKHVKNIIYKKNIKTKFADGHNLLLCVVNFFFICFLFKKINNIEKRFKSFYKNIIPVGIIKKSTLIENNKILKKKIES